MMKKFEQGHERKKDLAATAARIFAQASIDYPASVSFQGVRIAELCAKEKLSPLLLRSYLFTDSKQQEQLIRTANSSHKAHNVDAGDVTIDRFFSVVDHDFAIAYKMSNVDSETRAKFLDLYPVHQDLKSILDSRDVVEHIFENVINTLSSNPPNADLPAVLKETLLFSLLKKEMAKNFLIRSLLKDYIVAGGKVFLIDLKRYGAPRRSKIY